MMDSERELPTDDAFMESDGEGSRGDAKPSESLLTLRQSWSPEPMTGSSNFCSDAIHIDFLVEKGWIDYDSLDQPNEAAAGDYSRCLTSSSDLGGIEEIVNEMRNEFIGKLSSNAKGLKKILIMGVMKADEGRSVLRDHNSELEAKNPSEIELEVPKNMNVKEVPDEKLSTEDGNPDDHIIQLISDINPFACEVKRESDSVDHNSEQADNNGSEVEFGASKFTNDKVEEELSTKDDNRDVDTIIKLIGNINQFNSEVERDPDGVDWSYFRANLLKIHRRYVRNPATTAHQIEVPSSDISAPVDDLKRQARDLRRKVQSLESKILNLDQTFEDFSENFKRSLVSKDSADHEMVGLSIMQDRIGQRLSELEDEFRWARRQLFRGAEDKQVLPFLN